MLDRIASLTWSRPTGAAVLVSGNDHAPLETVDGAAVSGSNDIVEYELRVAARPEIVFAYFTDPSKMVQWIGTEATLDPRPGGICRINPNGAAPVRGEFVEVDPPRRIVFTWGFEAELVGTPPRSTAVEVSLTPDGDGTLLRLKHRRLSRGQCLHDLPDRRP